MLGIVIMYSFKSLIIWMHQDKIKILKNKLRKIHLSTEPSKYLAKDMKILKFIENFSINLLACRLILILFSTIFINLSSNNIERVLIFKVYIPFNYQPIVPFILVLIWEEWISWTGLLLETSNSGLLHGFIIILSSELEMIGDAFKSFDFKNDLQNLKPIIIKYQELIDLAVELESIFSFSNFTTFIISTLLMCFTILEILSITDQTIRYIIFIIFFIVMLNHVFFLCYYCQKLESASLSVAEKLSETNWYETNNRKLRIAVEFTLVRSQKSIKLTAANFTVMNLQTFKNVSQLKYTKIF